MNRSEMREIVAQESNQEALLQRDIPDIDFIIGLATIFRTRIAEAHTRSAGDAIEQFAQAFDDALDDLVRVRNKADG